MAKKTKFDGVIEAVHYSPDGMVIWVRAYERRGPTFSDRVLIQRDSLIEKIKTGKVFMVGRRIPHMASTFEVSNPVKVEGTNGNEVLVSGDEETDGRDLLEGVPII